MKIDATISSVVDLLHLQGGYSFRGSIEGVVDGNALAVQMKDVDPEHGVNWAGALRTNLSTHRLSAWLKEEDILLVSKGSRFYAVCLDHPPHPAVCSPHFFHLQVKSTATLMPAFVAWQINQAPFQRQLLQAAEGSSQLSIRRPLLEALTLSIPSLPVQQSIVALAELARQERQILKQLIRNREQQINALADGLFSTANLHLQGNP